MATTRRIRLPLPYSSLPHPARRGAASVYDLIERRKKLLTNAFEGSQEADQNKIIPIRKSALGSFWDLGGDRGPHE
jgi:hypothetical protein